MTNIIRQNLNTVPIPRATRLSYRDFYDCYDLPQQPIVIEGVANDWPAAKLWTHQWFGVNFGDVNIEVSHEKTHTRKAAQLRLGRYIDLIRDGQDKGLYMDQFSLDRLPGLHQHIRTPYANPDRRNVDLNLWIGPAGTSITLHKDHHIGFDYADNIFAQLWGRKQAVLVSPAQDELMYPRTKEQGANWHSQVDWENPDFERFPLFRDVTLQTTILEPGELLFIPGNYWHSLRSLDKSISVSCWWRVHRIADKIVSAFRFKQNQHVVVEPISLKDIEEFGGFDQVVTALQHEDVPPSTRDLVLSLMQPSVRDILNAQSERRSTAEVSEQAQV